MMNIVSVEIGDFFTYWKFFSVLTLHRIQIVGIVVGSAQQILLVALLIFSLLCSVFSHLMALIVEDFFR